ncbi:hypothetical protein M422DRAFT_200144 [Sphaerobolus stellatus SS14]|nr:hypothetical protein M422DRAFT_200144 [Sphaerobolus stellatus SS14]
MLPELKRQRTVENLEEVARPSSATMQSKPRHSDLWFDDGSVVLRAECPTMLFRVHRALIARHSEVFRNMFEIPQPPNNEQSEMIEGCPVIDLHDNSADLASLLCALYDGPTWGDNGPEDFETVAGVLRLSHKYLIDQLRTKAIVHLEKAWPTTLEAWDAREEIARWYDGETSPKGGRYPNPIHVIELARAVNAHSLLPSAFYDISRFTFSAIFEMTPGLFLQDTQRLAIGKEASQVTVTNLITNLGHGRCATSKLGFPMSKTLSCHSPVSCRKDFSELVELATQHYLFDRERGCTDPLYVAEELGQLKSAELSECKACAYALETWSNKEREKIWRSIPTWFRLNGWDSS